MMKLWPARFSRQLPFSALAVRLGVCCVLGLLSAVGASAQSSGVSFKPTFLNFPQQALGTVSSPLSVVLTNSTGADLTVSGFTVTGTNSAEFTLTPPETCTAAPVPNAGNCVVNVTFSPNTTGSPSATLIVTDTVGTQTVGLAGTVLSSGSETLSLGPAAGGSVSATVTAGSIATYNLSLGGSGFSGTVTLTCSGAPTGVNCTVPGTETLSGTAVAVTVTVSTTANSGRMITPLHRQPWMWAFALLGFVGLPAVTGKDSRQGRRRGTGFAVLLLLLVGVGGSGGGATNASSITFTPPGTYALTVTATTSVNSMPVTQTQVLTLTVQ